MMFRRIFAARIFSGVVPCRETNAQVASKCGDVLEGYVHLNEMRTDGPFAAITLDSIHWKEFPPPVFHFES